jgi:hypothetical protein
MKASRSPVPGYSAQPWIPPSRAPPGVQNHRGFFNASFGGERDMERTGVIDQIRYSAGGPLSPSDGGQGQGVFDKSLGAADESKRGEFHEKRQYQVSNRSGVSSVQMPRLLWKCVVFLKREKIAYLIESVGESCRVPNN